LFFLLFLVQSSSAGLKIIKKISLKVSIDRMGLPKFFNEDPPIYIIEGHQGELIVPRFVCFEVFSKDGKKLKKVGARGEGPGAFTTIFSIKKDSNFYYVHDYLNKINEFDKDFNYTNRHTFFGPRCSNFYYDFSVYKNKIYCVQNCQSGSDNIDNGIAVYLKSGKFEDAFFERKVGEENFPFRKILEGIILVDKDYIFYAFNPIPKIWKLDLKGNIIEERKVASDWWRDIQYSERKFKKRERENKRRAYIDLFLSGYRIKNLWKWKDNVIVQTVVNKNGDFYNSFFVISQDFKKESKLFMYRDYQFSGAGERIYLTKEIEERGDMNTMLIEVLVCDINF